MDMELVQEYKRVQLELWVEAILIPIMRQWWRDNGDIC